VKYISRHIEKDVEQSLANNPVTAIIGPRQCGKSTLARRITGGKDRVVYLDLERPSDLQKLEEPEWFFSSQKENLFCIDEIQRKPDLFPLIRSLSDEWNENGKFLILGSASRDLLQQSSESLAGRISYIRLTPFLWNEIRQDFSLDQYMEKGGFPRSILADKQEISFQWREDFISTFLERDLLQWAGISPATMQRLWQMLAWNNGQTVNHSRLGNSLGVSNVTIANYIDLLSETFMLEIIPPYIKNTKKRLVKSPKVYISDSGITSALLQLSSKEQIMGHPASGAIWEQLVYSNLKGYYPSSNIYFYRTSAGAEIDFVMTLKNRVFAIECKSTLSPSLSKGNYNAIEDIKPDHAFVVIPGEKGWPVKERVDVVSLEEVVGRMI